MSGGNRLPPCILQKRTFYGGEAITESDLGTSSTEGTHQVDEAPDPGLGWRASVAEAQPWRPALLQGDRVRQEWSGQHAYP